MVILGLNILHDATATLLVNGKIAASIAEERLSRIKYHCGFPYKSITEVLRIAGVSPQHVDKVVFSFNSNLSKMPRYYTDYVVDRSGDFDTANEKDVAFRTRMIRDQIMRRFRGGDPWQDGREYALKKYRRALAECGITTEDISTRDHHLAHAASAYYQGGKDRTLIITGDGSGDGQSMAVFVGEGGELKRLHSVLDRHSLGKFYSSITKYLGFKRNRHEGKITGLAAYGDPDKLKPELRQMVDIADDLHDFRTPIAEKLSPMHIRRTNLIHFLRGDYYGSHYSNLQLDYLHDTFKYRFHKGKPISSPPGLSGNTYHKEDIAAAAQALLEENVNLFTEAWVKETGIRDVVLAGGIFANVKVNQRVVEIDGVDSVFIHPNMGDGGTATGAAMLVWSDHLKEQNKVYEPEFIEDVYYGPEYSESDIQKALLKHSYQMRRSNDIETEAGQLVAKKKVVGRFNGRMEYGPRALGNRSILADPTDPAINDWLNDRLQRTEFMPFAPSVLHEAAPKLYKNYKSGEYASYFMTITFDVENEWIDKAQAVSHVDGTARPQVVKESTNSSYYKILKEFERQTGLPLLVNTSFNTHEEPIVMTPEHALQSLGKGCVDVLAIGPFLVWKEGGYPLKSD